MCRRSIAAAGLGAAAILASVVPPVPATAGATTSNAVPVNDNAYWLAAADGAVYNFGGAPSFGSMYGRPLDHPVVGMAATQAGTGYWLVGSDGGIFTFGSARFYGSMGGAHLNQPIVGMAATPTGKGYWEVASDGIFTFGATTFEGSLGSAPQGSWVEAMSSTFTGTGYWLATATAVSNFGQAADWGSAVAVSSPIVAMATGVGTGEKTTPPVYGDPTVSSPHGSTGYDVSSCTCGNLPPQPYTIGVVQVAGASFAALNSCFGREVTWAGPGLSLYLFLTHGASASAEPGCAGNPTAPTAASCNFGYAAGLHAYDAALGAIGARANVTGWLDIEQGGWTPTLAANRSTVVGAYDALRAAGPRSVGFYFSISNWNDIVGNYNPGRGSAVPGVVGRTVTAGQLRQRTRRRRDP